LTAYCAFEFFVHQAPKKDVTASNQKDEQPAGTIEADLPDSINSGASKPKSLLGPENKELLFERGYRLIEFPSFNRWEKELPPLEEPFVETEILIAENGEVIIDASIFDIHRDCAWKPGSAAKLAYENGQPCDLEKVLKGPKYQRRLALAHNIAFIGLQSYPIQKQPYHCESHDTLSECRFMELSARTRRAMPDQWSGRQRWGFDLGRANSDNKVLEFDQRRALVVGIKEHRSEVDVRTAIGQVTLSTKFGLLDLNDYEFSKSAKAVPLKIATGKAVQHE